MQLWLFLPYTHQHPFLLPNSFTVSTFAQTMRDLASISSFSLGNLNISHFPAPYHQTAGQSYAIKRYQRPVGCFIDVSSAGEAWYTVDQPGTTHYLLLLGMAAPSFRCPQEKGPVGDTKPPAEMWFAELRAKHTPSLDTGCNVPSESLYYRPLVGFFIFSYWHH